jgi:hypothetical protein
VARGELVNTVVVLCGGKGTRQNGQVKSLLRVGDRPFVDHKLAQLAAQGADHAVLLVAYGADAIREHLSCHPPALAVTYVYDDQTIGPWQAVWHARPYLPNRFYVTMGDVLCDIPLESDVEPPWMAVTTNSPSEPYNTHIADGWCIQQAFDDPHTHLDCGLYETTLGWLKAGKHNWYVTPMFRPRYVTARTYQINTPESTKECSGHLLGLG